MKINPKIISLIQDSHLDFDLALAFILLYEYDNVSVLPLDPISYSKEIHKIGIYERNYDEDRLFRLKFPLFINEEDISWIQEYRDLFSSKNIGVAGKMGDPSSCVEKMKNFLKSNPYDKNTIIEATKLYLSKTDMKYVRRADYFIAKEKQGSGKISDLSMWCEEVINNGGSINNPFEIQV